MARKAGEPLSLETIDLDGPREGEVLVGRAVNIETIASAALIDRDGLVFGAQQPTAP